VNILAVDTALGACSAALLQGDEFLAHRLAPMDRGHAEALAPMVESVLRESSLSMSELDRLAVTTGPGTFTGQRVGLAFMRGLRVALRIPLSGITSLEAMMVSAIDQTGADHAAAVHDAKRNEVYLALASRDEILIAPCLLQVAEAVSAIESAMQGMHRSRLAIAGTAAAAVSGSLRLSSGDTVSSSIAWPDARWVARLARDVPAGRVPTPLYLRPPDARQPVGKT